MFATQSTRQSASLLRPPPALKQHCCVRTAACKASKKEAEHGRGNLVASLCMGLVGPSLPAMQALADEVAPAQGGTPSILGLPAQEFFLLTAPVLLYTVFSIWRTAVNPNLKLIDFLFFLAAAVIVGNIASIVVFKIRYF